MEKELNEAKVAAPLVSVVVPVYNAGRYLHQCLRSLQAQTLDNIEIVCVLDCPTDGSDRVAEQYAAADGRIRIVRNERNLNIGFARNAGLRAARGQYIGISDHDDTHTPDMYARLLHEARRSGADVVFSGPLARFMASLPEGRRLPEAFVRVMARGVTTHVTPHLYGRSFIGREGLAFVDNNVCSVEDTLFTLRVLQLLMVRPDARYALVPELFYTNVVTGNNTNRGFAHWALSKVRQSLHEAEALARGQRMVSRGRCDEALALMAVRSLYTSFLREVRQHGLFPTLRAFHALRRDDALCARLVAQARPTRRDYSLAKNLFLLMMKVI